MQPTGASPQMLSETVPVCLHVCGALCRGSAATGSLSFFSDVDAHRLQRTYGLPAGVPRAYWMCLEKIAVWCFNAVERVSDRAASEGKCKMCLNFGGKKERRRKTSQEAGLFLHICGFQTMNPDDLSSVVTAPPLCFRMNFIVTIPSSKLVLISPSFWWLNRASQSCWLIFREKYCTVSLQVRVDG